MPRTEGRRQSVLSSSTPPSIPQQQYLASVVLDLGGGEGRAEKDLGGTIIIYNSTLWLWQFPQTDYPDVALFVGLPNTFWGLPAVFFMTQAGLGRLSFIQSNSLLFFLHYRHPFEWNPLKDDTRVAPSIASRPNPKENLCPQWKCNPLPMLSSLYFSVSSVFSGPCHTLDSVSNVRECISKFSSAFTRLKGQSRHHPLQLGKGGEGRRINATTLAQFFPRLFSQLIFSMSSLL